jgi:transposase InsO family protein
VSEHGIQCDVEKTRVLKSWKKPTTTKELRQFLGFSGFYRKFVRDYALIAQPLNKLLEGEKPKKRSVSVTIPWGDEQQSAFDTLIDRLSSPPVLSFPDFSYPFILRVDASREGLGAVLCQDQQDGSPPHVISYASRSLKKSEQNYTAHKLEFLALRWAVTKKFRDYLYGARFTITTDNNPLTYLLTTAKLDATGHRWLAELSTFNFDIKYKPGVQNIDADVLSRLPRVPPESISEETVTALCHGVMNSDTPVVELVSMGQHVDEFSYMDVPEVDWRKEQLADEAVADVLRQVEDGSDPDVGEMSVESRRFVKEWEHLKLMSGVLYRQVKTDGVLQRQLVLPSTQRLDVIRRYHEDIGHLGRDKTFSIVRSRFFWPLMRKDVETVVKSCDRCIRRKAPQLPQRASLVSISTTQPLELVCMDFLSLEGSKGGYANILVITDHFTKYSLAFATKNQLASTTARVLFDNFIVPYGIPMKLHSDQGRNFESRVIQELCNLTGIIKSRTTPYHAQGNGITERVNRTLLSMMGTLSEEKKLDWKSHLPHLVHAYNSTRHESTGYSPHFLMFGREPRLAADVVLGLHYPGQDHNDENYTEYAKHLKKRLNYAYRLASAHNKKSSARQKKHYDVKVRGATVEVGDRVLVRRLGFQGKHKLSDKWERDAYLVLEQPHRHVPVFRIQREDGKGRVRTLHRNLLLPLSLPVVGIPVRIPERRPDRSSRDIGKHEPRVEDPLPHSSDDDHDEGQSLE